MTYYAILGHITGTATGKRILATLLTETIISDIRITRFKYSMYIINLLTILKLWLTSVTFIH